MDRSSITSACALTGAEPQLKVALPQVHHGSALLTHYYLS
jgi:hypothetical protein